MADSYLTVQEFRARTTMPMGDVDEIEQSEEGYILARLTARTARINSQLRKRYTIPFAAPVPEVVLDWLATVVTPDLWLKRGVNPSDAQVAAIFAMADKAWAEIEKAADCETGLYDLPLREDTAATGISQGGPFSSSQASPYAWMDVQRTKATQEDSNG